MPEWAEPVALIRKWKGDMAPWEVLGVDYYPGIGPIIAQFDAAYTAAESLSEQQYAEHLAKNNANHSGT